MDKKPYEMKDCSAYSCKDIIVDILASHPNEGYTQAELTALTDTDYNKPFVLSTVSRVLKKLCSPISYNGHLYLFSTYDSCDDDFKIQRRYSFSQVEYSLIRFSMLFCDRYYTSFKTHKRTIIEKRKNMEFIVAYDIEPDKILEVKQWFLSSLKRNEAYNDVKSGIKKIIVYKDSFIIFISKEPQLAQAVIDFLDSLEMLFASKSNNTRERFTKDGIKPLQIPIGPDVKIPSKKNKPSI